MNKKIKIRRIASPLLLLGLLLGLSACGNDFGAQSAGQLTVSPQTLQFAASIGETNVQSATLKNIGKGKVTITSAKLVEDHLGKADYINGEPDLREFVKLELKKGGQRVKLPVSLSSGESLKAEVTFKSLDRYADTGKVLFSVTGDPQAKNGKVAVDLKSGKIEPLIYGENPVQFTTPVQPLQWACKDVKYTNRGTEDLVLKGKYLHDPPHFFDAVVYTQDPSTLSSTGIKCDGTPNPLTDTQKRTFVNNSPGDATSKWDGITPLRLAPAPADDSQPAEAFYVRYFFFPDNTQPAKATLNFDSNAEQSSISVEANSSQFCMNVDGLDAGTVRFGASVPVVVTITNCSNDSDQKLKIDSVQLENNPELEAIGDLPKDVELDQGDSVQVNLKYTPAAPPDDKIKTTLLSAKLTVKTNDKDHPEREFTITGEGRKTLAPVAYIQYKEETTGVFKDTKNVKDLPPDKTIYLSGQKSSADTTGTGSNQCTITSYEWKYDSLPPGVSENQMPVLNKSALPQGISFPSPGHYVIRLIVTDSCGNESDGTNEHSRISFDVKPDADIFVTISWITLGTLTQNPDAPKISVDDPTNPGHSIQVHPSYTGADVDLHLAVGARANWSDKTGTDVYYDHKHLSSPSVTMSRDEREGSGPENISVKKSSDNTVYKVGVQLFDSHGASDTLVTVKIYIKGVLKFETGQFPPSAYLRQDQFWWVANIVWGTDDANIITKNVTYENEGDANQAI